MTRRWLVLIVWCVALTGCVREDAQPLQELNFSITEADVQAIIDGVTGDNPAVRQLTVDLRPGVIRLDGVFGEDPNWTLPASAELRLSPSAEGRVGVELLSFSVAGFALGETELAAISGQLTGGVAAALEAYIPQDGVAYRVSAIETGDADIAITLTYR